MSDRIAEVQARGAKRVTSFATLGWKHPEVFLPYYAMNLPHHVLEAKDDVVRGFELFGDERSREHFVAHLRLRLHLDFAGLLEPDPEPEYFAPDLYALSEEERFVDCGAYDGDTVRRLLALVPTFRGRVVSFEPDAATFARLEAWRLAQPLELRDRIAIHRAGVGARRERVDFREGGGTGSAVGVAGGAGAGVGGGAAVDVVPLDEVVLDLEPTLVKADVEGYEPEVIEGARRLLTAQRPVLALCVYHRQDHPWRVPLMVADLHRGAGAAYRYTLRNYCLDGWDMTFYAVPEHRSLPEDHQGRR